MKIPWKLFYENEIVAAKVLNEETFVKRERNYL